MEQANGSKDGGALAERTLATLRDFFDQQSHHPSEDHWFALRDVAETMEAMADGTCPPKVFLSALDCGVGKSQTAVHFARALNTSPEHGDVGMLICVGRIAEARAIADALSGIRNTVAVLTSDETANALSGTEPDNAQVLITTQQRVERATDGRSFGDAAPFHYHGQPRAVRVWDESWLPGVAVTLNADDLGFLPKLIRPWSAECAEALPRFMVSLAGVEDGALVNVPDFEALYGISLYDVLAAAAGTTGPLSDDQQMTATALITLSGRTARARKDGRNGSTILTYRDTLPEDLMPLLVLDASGRVRQTYSWMERHRGNLVRLREAVKDYGPLTIHAWQTAGSKSGFERNGDALVKGIVDTITTRPNEPWLVVVHKTGGRVKDTEKAIKRQLTAEQNRNVSVITWGAHLATNAYSDVPNVILAGTLFMRDSFYTALTHLAQARDVIPGLAPSADVAATMKGEHAHLILQAICRGRVRKSNGAQCQPMTAYVIASKRSGIPRDLTNIFPNCTVRPWNPLRPVLKGNLKKAVDFVKEAVSRGESWIAFGDIRTALKMSAQDFRRRVSRAAAWNDAIAHLGLSVTSGPRGAKGLSLSGAA